MKLRTYAPTNNRELYELMLSSAADRRFVPSETHLGEIWRGECRNCGAPKLGTPYLACAYCRTRDF